MTNNLSRASIETFTYLQQHFPVTPNPARFLPSCNRQAAWPHCTAVGRFCWLPAGNIKKLPMDYYEICRLYIYRLWITEQSVSCDPDIQYIAEVATCKCFPTGQQQTITWDTPQFKTRSSAMAEGLRDPLVSTEKLAIDEWLWHTPKVITVAAIKWLYDISLPVCGLLFQRLYLGPFLRHYHFWSERDCLGSWELLHFWQRSLSYKPRDLSNLCVNIS